MPKSLTVTLSDDLLEMVRKRVGSGAYMDESEVVRDGLRALQAQDRAVERWLHEDVVPTYDRVARGEEPLIPADDVFTDIEARYRRLKERAP